MNSYKYPISIRSISEMLYGEQAYIKEFADAAYHSFQEFTEKYREHLLSRNETDFRRAGHKIKPVAQMLDVHIIIEEYEKAKKLLWDNAPDETLNNSVVRIEEITRDVQSQLKELLV